MKKIYKFKYNNCGRGRLKKGILPNRFGPRKQLGLTTHYLKSSTIRIIQIVRPRKLTRPRSVHSSGDYRQTTKAI